MTGEAWAQYGARMVRSVVCRWDAELLPLTVYAEGFTPPPMPGLVTRELPEWLGNFKAIWGRTPAYTGHRIGGYDYRFDAVKFAHKVAALTDFALSLDAGEVAIWIDADTYTHAPVSAAWLEKLFPEPAYIAWLDRVNAHPECGFMMFRTAHEYHRGFMEALRDLYTSGSLFKLRETHDSFAIQHLVHAKVINRKIPPPASLSGDTRWHHPFVNGPLGACFDHLKGPNRKGEGRSRAKDMRAPRPEPYWKDGNR